VRSLLKLLKLLKLVLLRVACCVLRALGHVMYDYDYMERSIGVLVCKVILLLCGLVQEKEERKLFKKLRKINLLVAKPKAFYHNKSMKGNSW
jgi:hypothetical protein